MRKMTNFIEKTAKFSKNVFSKMQKINTELKNIYSQYKGELSMGMSDDYEIALDYGATIVRVGSKIFK